MNMNENASVNTGNLGASGGNVVHLSRKWTTIPVQVADEITVMLKALEKGAVFDENDDLILNGQRVEVVPATATKSQQGHLKILPGGYEVGKPKDKRGNPLPIHPEAGRSVVDFINISIDDASDKMMEAAINEPGLFGQMARYLTSATTHAIRELIIANTLAATSTLVKRAWVIPPIPGFSAGQMIDANIFVIMSAGSAMGKSGSMGRLKAFIDAGATRHGPTGYVYSKVTAQFKEFSSWSAMAIVLARRPCLTVTMDEAKRALDAMKGSKADYRRAILDNIYPFINNEPLKLGMVKEDADNETIEFPHISLSLFMACTKEQAFTLFTDKDMREDGFISRLIPFPQVSTDYHEHAEQGEFNETEIINAVGGLIWQRMYPGGEMPDTITEGGTLGYQTVIVPEGQTAPGEGVHTMPGTKKLIRPVLPTLRPVTIAEQDFPYIRDFIYSLYDFYIQNAGSKSPVKGYEWYNRAGEYIMRVALTLAVTRWAWDCFHTGAKTTTTQPIITRADFDRAKAMIAFSGAYVRECYFASARKPRTHAAENDGAVLDAVIANLSRCDGRTTMRDLARNMHLNNATLTTALHALEAQERVRVEWPDKPKKPVFIYPVDLSA